MTNIKEENELAILPERNIEVEVIPESDIEVLPKYLNVLDYVDTLDLDKMRPRFRMVSTNRSAGKTFSALKMALEDFKETGNQITLLYRHNYELSASNVIFEDVLDLYPNIGKEMTSKPVANGLYYQLLLDGEIFGFSVALKKPDPLKKHSATFKRVQNIIMDEFQLETGEYLKDEFTKLESVLITIARGGGKQSREVDVWLLGNNVSLMNPYYIKYDIHKRLRADTKAIRGHGWVAFFDFNESASNAIKNNRLFVAFGDSAYMKYSTEKTYLVDDTVFVEKPKGRSKYLFTICQDNEFYGVYEFYEQGYIYVSTKHDPSNNMRVTFNAVNHNQNTIMLNKYSFLWKNIRDAYEGGFLRFDTLKSKNIIFDILSIDLLR